MLTLVPLILFAEAVLIGAPDSDRFTFQLLGLNSALAGGDDEAQARENPNNFSSSLPQPQNAAATDTDVEHFTPRTRGRRGAKYQNQCSTCGKYFKKPSDLIRHVRIHTGEKPFRCEVCSREFTVKSTLDSHHKTHGPGILRQFFFLFNQLYPLLLQPYVYCH